MLNLHQLWIENPADESYVRNPFFVHPLLNRSIILKHNMRRGEEGRFGQRRLGATKIVLPLDVRDLGLGGQFLFVGQSDFVQVLCSALDYTDLDLERDLKMITVLDSIPSMDPFLLYQVSQHYRMDIGRCYFRMSRTDIEMMTGFVKEEITPLVEMSLGLDQRSQEGTERLTNLLIADAADDPSLASLRDALRMTPQQFSSAMFSWKALMFYKRQLKTIQPELKTALLAISRLKPPRRGSNHLADYVERTKRRIRGAAAQAWREANYVITQYEHAYAGMLQARRPAQFRNLLLDTHHRYISLGLRVARLESVASYWALRTGKSKKPLPVEDLCALLVDLDHNLCTDLTLPTAIELKAMRDRMNMDEPTDSPSFGFTPALPMDLTELVV